MVIATTSPGVCACVCHKNRTVRHIAPCCTPKRVPSLMVGGIAFDPNAPRHSFRLAEAALCINCDEVFLFRRGECPRCASRIFESLAKFVDGAKR